MCRRNYKINAFEGESGYFKLKTRRKDKKHKVSVSRKYLEKKENETKNKIPSMQSSPRKCYSWLLFHQALRRLTGHHLHLAFVIYVIFRLLLLLLLLSMLLQLPLLYQHGTAAVLVGGGGSGRGGRRQDDRALQMVVGRRVNGGSVQQLALLLGRRLNDDRVLVVTVLLRTSAGY